MAEGINIKVLPEATDIQGNDRILIDKNVVGTQIIPFSAIIVNEDQVSFYTDFVDLSAYTYALSSNTNDIFSKLETNIGVVSTNVIQLSSQTNPTLLLLKTDVNSVSGDVIDLQTTTNLISTNVIQLSSQTDLTSFLLRTDLNVVSANTADFQTSIDSVSADLEQLSYSVDANNILINTLFEVKTTFVSGGISPSGLFIPDNVGILYFAADTKDYFLSVGNETDQDWRRILTVDY
jgi:hypothetical protein